MFFLSLVLTACAPTVESFEEDFTPAYCEWFVPCADSLDPMDDTGEVSTASCESEITDYIDTVKNDDGCTFDPDAAQACLDSLEAPTCSDAENIRDACENIFTGDDCDLPITALL